MTAFQPGPALLGGALVGLGLTSLLFATGRTVGVSGVVGGLLRPVSSDVGWRVAFIVGMLAGGGLLAAFVPGVLGHDSHRSVPTLAIGGLLVGFGTRLGNGCTSGHGVCGIGRLSPRSLVATAIFVGTGAVTVFIVDHVFKGRL